MAIIRKRSVVEDPWQPEWRREHGAERCALPPGDVIVSLARWYAERDLMRSRAGRVGVVLGPDDDVEGLSPDLSRLDLIALDFQTFSDGRGYSQARLLRARYGYRGEIRAIGAVSSDLVPFMERCGIDAFELPVAGVGAALAAFEEITVHYQPSANGDCGTAPRLRGLRHGTAVGAAE